MSLNFGIINIATVVIFILIAIATVTFIVEETLLVHIERHPAYFYLHII